MSQGELEEIAAIARRAEVLGLDPRRVLTALGVDPLTYVNAVGAEDWHNGSSTDLRPRTAEQAP